MSIILNLEAKEILDSRGNPTIFTVCTLQSQFMGSASVPSGASTGKHEAYELRDGDLNRFNGKGVLKAVDYVNIEILNSLVGKDFDQNTLDQYLIQLDGTKNKEKLGANAILSVSLAFARAVANEKELKLYVHLSNLHFKNEDIKIYKLPQPAFNVINGGKHSNSGLSFQEFMLIPQDFHSFKTKVEVANNIISNLKNSLIQDGQSVEMGDEGGFAPKISSNQKAIEYLETAIVSSGYNMDQVKLGIDVAASSFFKNGEYFFENKIQNKEEMLNVYEDLCSKHKIISIEDGLDEEDFTGFTEMNKKLGDKINIVGDDITVTNVELIKKAINSKSINTVLIKLNQIGTLSETLNAIKLAQENNIKIFISHRSGETEDTFISDLAVAVGADFIKAGAPTKKERIVKYDRLIEIEDEIKNTA